MKDFNPNDKFPMSPERWEVDVYQVRLKTHPSFQLGARASLSNTSSYSVAHQANPVPDDYKAVIRTAHLFLLKIFFYNNF